jgi:hypothetical protein
MSVEPNQSMEDQLRTQAERRRLEAPAFELDGAARHRLQEEVRRVYRAKAAPSTAPSLGWFWTRLGLVGAATVAALFLSVQLLERQSSLYPSQPAVPSLELAALDDSAESREQPHRELDSPSSALTIADGSLPAESLSVPFAPEHAAEPAAMRPAPAPTAAMTEPTLAVRPDYGIALAGDQATDGTVRLGQQFQRVQQYRRNPNSPAPPRVLQSFQWVREGDVVRIIDEDGSVYTGALGVTAKGTARDRYAVSIAMKEVGRGADQPAQLRPMAVDRAEIGERFMVAGTNRTLNVPVKFEGVLIPHPGMAQTITNAVRTEPSAVSQAATQIQGQALVGGSTRLGIVADARAE